MLNRWWRGISSTAGMFAFPLGHWWCRNVDGLKSADRLERGLVLVLPGIQAKSPVEYGVARGLNDAGIDMGIEIYDWTTGSYLLFTKHLCGIKRNRFEAEKLAARIIAYQDQYPGRPVYLIGHSGGAGLSLLAMEALPHDRKVTRLILLSAAVSPQYDLSTALEHTTHGIWNFHSHWDLFFLGLGTTTLGTIDRHHTFAAGFNGFHEFNSDDENVRLHQQRYCFKMLSSWNFGGHFGSTNRVFCDEWLAPLMQETVSESAASSELAP